jgi:hypothetical protein
MIASPWLTPSLLTQLPVLAMLLWAGVSAFSRRGQNPAAARLALLGVALLIVSRALTVYLVPGWRVGFYSENGLGILEAYQLSGYLAWLDALAQTLAYGCVLAALLRWHTPAGAASAAGRRLTNWMLWLSVAGLLLVVGLGWRLLSSPDTGDQAGTFRGIYFQGFETSGFRPCGGSETWWVNQVPRSDFKQFVQGDGFRVYVEWTGTRSGRGIYGHMGMYRRRLDVEKVILAREALPADCGS